MNIKADFSQSPGRSTVAPVASRSPGRDESASRPGANTGDRVEISDVSRSLEWARDRLMLAVGKEIDAAFEKLGASAEGLGGMDMSPAATANRLVDFATGLLGAYREQNGELSEAEQTKGFEQTLRESINAGYETAISELKLMGYSDEDLAITRETMSLVDDGLSAFFTDLVEASAKPSGGEDAATTESRALNPTGE